VDPFGWRDSMIIAMAGLPGTGKSTLARALADDGGGVVLDKDVIRSILFPPAYVEYSNEQDDFCQSLMLETAGYLLQRHTGLRIFLDGRTFSRKYQLENAVETARHLKSGWRVIECVCSEETARRRLEASAITHPARNRNFELYRRLQAQFEPIASPKLVVNTDTPLEQCVSAARAYLE
jgi:adenylylsulfate kinase